MKVIGGLLLRLGLVLVALGLAVSCVRHSGAIHCIGACP